MGPTPFDQKHDFNGGIQQSGLFWVVELPDNSIHVSGNGRHASMEAKDVPVIDSFQFGNPVSIPASVTFSVDWDASGPTQHLVTTGDGAFVGDLSPGFARCSFSGRDRGSASPQTLV